MPCATVLGCFAPTSTAGSPGTAGVGVLWLLWLSLQGIVTPAISSGARFATEEQIANNKVRWDRWTLRYLPNLSRKLVEMWAVFRMHKYHFRVAYLPADAKSPPPTFESWDEAVGNPQVMSHQQGGGVGGGPMTGQTGEWQVTNES